MDKRWLDQLQQPLHAAAHYLNPQVYWATLGSPELIESDQSIKEGLLDCIGKLSEDFEEESKILVELVPYRTRRGRLGRANVVASIQSLAPVKWWITFGSEIPNLQKFAKRVLGLTTLASPCETNWSAFKNLHTKKRNRSDHEKLNDLVYVQYKKRIRKRFEERVMGSEVDPIVLKTMEEWLDPHDARDDLVEGTDFTYGILEDAEGSENDEHPPPITRQQTYKRRRTNTNASSQPESSSREITTSTRTSTRARARSSQV
ncbi:uncharacterized protein LOC113280537 [Papaver somniferum]|uniref:uncharacterized protein LOC113280537 n=1 Tax=Papaver somniferum TaxID=3469 RepID=UPI000E6FB83A|nr:uncharacterized protein LOC113280537 [Papaver somniferum]